MLHRHRSAACPGDERRREDPSDPLDYAPGHLDDGRSAAGSRHRAGRRRHRLGLAIPRIELGEPEPQSRAWVPRREPRLRVGRRMMRSPMRGARTEQGCLVGEVVVHRHPLHARPARDPLMRVASGPTVRWSPTVASMIRRRVCSSCSARRYCSYLRLSATFIAVTLPEI